MRYLSSDATMNLMSDGEFVRSDGKADPIIAAEEELTALWAAQAEAK